MKTKHSVATKSVGQDRIAGTIGNFASRIKDAIGKMSVNPALKTRRESVQSKREEDKPVGEFKTAFRLYTRIPPFS